MANSILGATPYVVVEAWLAINVVGACMKPASGRRSNDKVTSSVHIGSLMCWFYTMSNPSATSALHSRAKSIEPSVLSERD
eukprot:6227625-Amphidinium_carterae.2